MRYVPWPPAVYIMVMVIAIILILAAIGYFSGAWEAQ